MSAVALIGAFTALMAATMGLVMNDIKRVMAYSTISQLGYMMAALGVGAYSAAIFHLFNHAFFKALLFLSAGSVNHATGTFDMRFMGGLRRYMPWTYATMMVASLSLAGIFPFSGFWSKDEILLDAWLGGSVVDGAVFWLLLVTVFLTAFYAFRMVFMTFHGEFRGGVEAEARAYGHSPSHSGHEVHLAESPVVMVWPMVLLAAGSLLSGYLANPPAAVLGIPSHWFSEFVVAPGAHPEVLPMNFGLASLSMVVALAGIALAGAIYLVGRPSPIAVGRAFRPAYTLFFRKYFMDDLYEGVIVARGFYRGFAAMLDWFDSAIVDGTVDSIGWFGRNVGRAMAQLQTGQVQGYAIAIFVGIILILVAYLVWG
jgi:NADH-quinone oxidoreductase subunit L